MFKIDYDEKLDTALIVLDEKEKGRVWHGVGDLVIENLTFFYNERSELVGIRIAYFKQTFKKIN